MHCHAAHEKQGELRLAGGPVSREHVIAETYLPDFKNINEIMAGFKADPRYGDVIYYANTPGRLVSQDDFAKCYLESLQKISDGARNLLARGLSRDDLKKIVADHITPELPGAVMALPDVPEKLWSKIQREHENLIRAEIVRLAAAPESDGQLGLRATCFALMTLEMAEQKLRMEALASDPRAQSLYEDYRRLMGAARELSAGDPLKAGHHFVRLVEKELGYTPALNVVSDYDGNLSVYLDKHELSGGSLKPGEQTNRLINELDRLAGLTWHHRLPLTECAGSNPALLTSAARMYNIACQCSALLSDTPDFCRTVANAGGRHTILSANHAAMVKTQMLRSGLASYFDRVFGVSWDFHYADNKPRILVLEALSQKRLQLNLFTEDDNSGVAKHLGSAEERIRQLGVDWNIRDLYFIASRPADSIWRNYRVSQALEQTGVDFIRDPYDAATGAGKSGSLSFLRAARGS